MSTRSAHSNRSTDDLNVIKRNKLKHIIIEVKAKKRMNKKKKKRFTKVCALNFTSLVFNIFEYTFCDNFEFKLFELFRIICIV